MLRIFENLKTIRNFGCVLFAVTMGGCSHSWVDEQGATHVVGLVSMTIKPTGAPETFAGQIIETRSFGVGAFQSAEGSGVNLGYLQTTSGFLKNNVRVEGQINRVR
jgi:hypothetical protein